MSTNSARKPVTQGERKDARRRILAKIHIQWKEMRPDLRHATSDLREGLLDFAAAELRIPAFGSLSELTNTQLCKVIDAMSRERAQPRLEGTSFSKPVAVTGTQAADVSHLASLEQRWALNRLFKYLGWSGSGCEAFLKSKYRRTTVAMLTTKQANALMRILMNIAASRDLKAQQGASVRISREMIRAYLPTLKKQLGM